METHYHMGAVTAIWIVAIVIAVMGTMHLLALSYPTTPAAEAIISLGF